MNLQHVLGQVIDPHGCTLWVGFTFAFACAHDAHRADDKPVFSRKLPEGRNQSKVFFHMFKHVRNWNNCLDIATEALGNRAFLFAEGAGHQRLWREAMAAHVFLQGDRHHLLLTAGTDQAAPALAL